MLSQNGKNIDLVRGIILNRIIHKANTEDNILKSIFKQINLSRSEAKEFLDCYVDQHWIVQKDEDGVNMYTLNPFSNLGGL
jgi:predicted transcriptional regulator